MNFAAKVLAYIGAGMGAKSLFNSGDWVSSSLPGNRYSSGRNIEWNPGSQINYAALAGDFWRNSMCQAILNWIILAWPESYPCVKRMQDAKKVVVPHPLTEILLNPNEFDDDTALWAGTIISFWCDGNAYWRINRTRGGQIAEFEFVPHWAITPWRADGSTQPGPELYKLSTTNGIVDLETYDVVHYRFGRDPNNDLLGMSPWYSICSEVYTDNEAVNYTASMLRNRGAAWMIVAPDSPEVGWADADQVRDTIEERTTGDNRNRVLVLDVPTKITLPPNYKDVGMFDVRRLPESRAAATSGIPGMAVGFASAQERSTFSNMDQAVQAAWYTLVAVQRMMGRQMTKQVLWRKENYNYKPNTIFAGFDYSEVRALQPDKAKEWKRVGDALEVGLIDDDEARAEIGYAKFTAAQRAIVAARIKPKAPPVDAQAGSDAQNAGAGKSDVPALPPVQILVQPVREVLAEQNAVKQSLLPPGQRDDQTDPEPEATSEEPPTESETPEGESE